MSPVCRSSSSVYYLSYWATDSGGLDKHPRPTNAAISWARRPIRIATISRRVRGRPLALTGVTLLSVLERRSRSSPAAHRPTRRTCSTTDAWHATSPRSARQFLTERSRMKVFCKEFYGMVSGVARATLANH